MKITWSLKSHCQHSLTYEVCTRFYASFLFASGYVLFASNSHLFLYLWKLFFLLFMLINLYFVYFIVYFFFHCFFVFFLFIFFNSLFSSFESNIHILNFIFFFVFFPVVSFVFFFTSVVTFYSNPNIFYFLSLLSLLDSFFECIIILFLPLLLFLSYIIFYCLFIIQVKDMSWTFQHLRKKLIPILTSF